MKTKSWEREYGWMLVGLVFVGLTVWELYLQAWISAVLYLLMGLGFMWWMRGWGASNAMSHRDARKALGAGDSVVIYWRPGCMFCSRLRMGLGRLARRAIWINIWRDDDAAEFVRSHNGGNELVPTVLMRGEVVPNPDVGDVRSALQGTGPHT